MILKLIFFVILAQESIQVVVKRGENKTRLSLIWDYADIDDSVALTTVPTKVVHRRPQKKPTFTQTGRRISRVKCQEYIWELKQMEQQMKSDRTKYYKLFREKRNHIIDAARTGRYSLPGEFPHMVAIGWLGKDRYVYKCGGSLISNKFVLTAAHCTKAPKSIDGVEDQVPKVVRLGDPSIGDDPILGFEPLIMNITKIIRHPDNVPPQMYNDIALLEIDKVKYSFLVHPACLWEFEVRNLAQHALITGWGVVETATRNTSSELQSAEVDIIPYYDCDTLLRPFCGHRWCGLQASQLCAGKLKGGVDTCQGDSGGPLQVRFAQRQARVLMYYVIGVTSFGVGCGRPNAPGVYTRVSSFIDWIETTVWPNVA